jgi:Rod binding domain-containing protein
MTEINPLNGPPPSVVNKTEKLKELATDLEASFLAEMLKSAGFGKVSEDYGGGIGEEQFSSFAIENHARKLAESGGIGLAEHIFKSLQGTQNNEQK